MSKWERYLIGAIGWAALGFASMLLFGPGLGFFLFCAIAAISAFRALSNDNEG